MKREIHGNIEGVRRTALDQMKLLYDLEIDADVFLPPELSRILAAYTAAMNREIAVYITRDGEIVDIMIGTHQDVELTDYRLRRNSKRLSCVRCIHTHPSATGPADARSMRRISAPHFERTSPPAAAAPPRR